MSNLLYIDTQKESERIISFIKNTFQTQGRQKAVIGLSEGVDSTTAFYLLVKALSPENVIGVFLPYFESDGKEFHVITAQMKLPKENILVISIKNIVASIIQTLAINNEDVVRRGNIMARVRMIVLFDIAKKKHGLVCGTENKTENFLSYFTKYGDQASDLEPILHLYKTQVFSLAQSLSIPTTIIEKTPSANLWKDQTDEKEFGFSYNEADQVLFLYFDEQLSLDEIVRKGFTNAKKIIDWVNTHKFKHNSPYTID